MLIPAGYAQVNFIFTGVAAPTGAQVTLGLDNTVGDVDAEAVATAARDAWEQNLLSIQNSGITLSGVLAKLGPNATGPSAEVSSGVAGTNGGESEVPTASLLVQKLTAQGGRTGRGRMYIPGITGDIFNSSGEASGPYVVAAQTAVNGFAADLATAILSPVLLHAPGSPVIQPTPIIGFQVQQRAATQRRRLRR